MAYSSVTINGGSGHIFISDSGALSTTMYSAFSSFIDEQGTFTGSSFSGFGTGSLTLYDRFDGGSTVITGSDTISTLNGASLTASFNVEEMVVGSTYQMTFGAAAGNASLTGAQKLSSSLLASPVSAAGGLSSFGVSAADHKVEMTGADTLAGSMAEAAKTTTVVPAATTINLSEGSKITLLHHTLKG